MKSFRNLWVQNLPVFPRFRYLESKVRRSDGKWITTFLENFELTTHEIENSKAARWVIGLRWRRPDSVVIPSYIIIPSSSKTFSMLFFSRPLKMLVFSFCSFISHGTATWQSSHVIWKLLTNQKMHHVCHPSDRVNEPRERRRTEEDEIGKSRVDGIFFSFISLFPPRLLTPQKNGRGFRIPPTSGHTSKASVPSLHVYIFVKIKKVLKKKVGRRKKITWW